MENEYSYEGPECGNCGNNTYDYIMVYLGRELRDLMFDMEKRTYRIGDDSIEDEFLQEYDNRVECRQCGKELVLSGSFEEVY